MKILSVAFLKIKARMKILFTHILNKSDIYYNT